MMRESKGGRAGERIRQELKRRGWTQADLAKVMDRPLPTINELITGRTQISPETAVQLQVALGVDAREWLALENERQLANIRTSDPEVERRAKLFDLAPVKEMEKRGWIQRTRSASELESALREFFSTASLESLPEIGAQMRHGVGVETMNSAQRAWCFRARQLALSVHSEPFTEKSFARGISDLRKVAAWPDATYKVPAILSEMGIRFVVIEPLAHSRIDGAAMWLDEDSPVVALSLRYDRIDSFWHTLGHELSHIRHRDGLMVDVDIVGDQRPTVVEQSETERRADLEASELLIDKNVLDDFVVRVGPLYSRARINQFANLLRIHPGIIVGQLHFRSEISYGSLRDTLEKVRDFITSTALTDGWDHVAG
jgi:HTH-type transcriptional regulator/antitoxin HigA